MLYIVNKHTKEHRRYMDAEEWADVDCVVVGADPDGWIEWHGGECPLPDGATHQIKMRGDGESPVDDAPESWRWDYYGRGDDIIAYRPIFDADTKPESPVWDGDGLPTVGAMAEISRDSLHGDGFQEGDIVEVLAHKRAKVSDVVIVWSDRVRKSVQLIPEMFRPLRSEEDRAAEEMLSIIEKHAGMSESSFTLCGNMAEAARALYRAGYRKTGGER